MSKVLATKLEKKLRNEKGAPQDFPMDEGEVIVVTKREKGGRKMQVPRAPEGYSKVEGSGRCSACVKEGESCEVDAEVLERLLGEAVEGKVLRSTPAGAVCWRCKQKKRRCELPAAQALVGKGKTPVKLKVPPKGSTRTAVPRAESTTPSAASGSKRKREVLVGVELPPKKRTKVAAEAVDDVQQAMLALLRRLDGRLAETMTEMRRATEAQVRVAEALARTAEARAKDSRVMTALLACLTRHVAPELVKEVKEDAPVAPAAVRSAATSEERVAGEVAGEEDEEEDEEEGEE